MLELFRPENFLVLIVVIASIAALITLVQLFKGVKEEFDKNKDPNVRAERKLWREEIEKMRYLRH